MFGQKKDWETRENAFAAFSMGPLTDFWRQREEAEFKGVDDVPVRFVRFCAQHNDRLVLICPGRIHWRKRFILAHSMGGAIATLFLQRYRAHCDAIALCAPMFGIIIRLPDWMVRHILDWAEGHQRIREEYAIGTGRWRALPFAVNVLTHSRQRYRRNLRFYADEPRLQVGGPTWHWVREGMLAGDEVLANVEKDTAPTLLLQAEEERVVDNLMHDRYCELRAAAGHPCEGGKPLVIEGAYHEILFEKDAMRSVALNAIVEFFNRHT